MLKLSFATLTPPASMTHPQNYFHSWAVNEGSDLAPFTLELWATVSAILITLARTWQLIRCSLTITDECPNSDAAASDFPTNLLFPLTEMLFYLTTRTTATLSPFRMKLAGHRSPLFQSGMGRVQVFYE